MTYSGTVFDTFKSNVKDSGYWIVFLSLFLNILQTHIIISYYNKIKYDPEEYINQEISNRLYDMTAIGMTLWTLTVFICFFTNMLGKVFFGFVFINSIYHLALSIIVIIDCATKPKLSIVFGTAGILYLILNFIFLLLNAYNYSAQTRGRVEFAEVEISQPGETTEIVKIGETGETE